MHALKATFQIARIFQACSLIAIIGLTANFIAEIVSINAKPPNVLIGTITVVCPNQLTFTFPLDSTMTDS